MRYFIELSYRGTCYHGWQIQHNAITVQQVLQEALQTLLKHKVELVGSGRTDTGVHALQQFAHFDTSATITANKFLYQLNAISPQDIAIKHLYKVSPEAHARFDALWRRYEYHIYQHKNPFLEGLALYYPQTLDIERMQEATNLLKQYDDFQAFSLVHTEVNNFLCRIHEAYWQPTAEGYVFHIKANRFLRGMVRAIVGTLLKVGTKRLNTQAFEEIIQQKDRRKAGEAIAPHGLFLAEIAYPNNLMTQVEK